MGSAVKEVSIEDFKEGLYRLAGEDQLEAGKLFHYFKETVIEEVTLSANAKKAGKTPAEVFFDRLKRRKARKHYRALRKNLGKRPSNTAAHHLVSWCDEQKSPEKYLNNVVLISILRPMVFISQALESIYPTRICRMLMHIQKSTLKIII